MAENSELQEWPQTRVEWRIKNYWNLSTGVGFCLNSPFFYLSNIKWHISLYPNGHTENNSEKWISVYLMKGNSIEECNVDVKIGIKYRHGTTFKALKEIFKFLISDRGKGYSKFIKRKLLRKSGAVSFDGTLIIFCSAAIVGDSLQLSTNDVASQTLYADGIPTLIGNFKDLYISKNFADVTITVGDRQFFAHKIVLVARSVVFSSMFTNDMTEKNSGRVEITDCDPGTFEEFLLFLYTGELSVVTVGNARSLYNTADKYDVQDLKNGCVRCMMNDLTVDSFCDVLRLATMRDEPEIRQAATDFFTENAEHILVTLKWHDFSMENPTLGNELFLKFVHKYKCGK